MSTGRRPDHCKGCVSYHNAGNLQLNKYSSWCCAKGAEAKRSVGWCKTHNKKTISQAAQYLLETEKGLIVDTHI